MQLANGYQQIEGSMNDDECLEQEQAEELQIGEGGGEYNATHAQLLRQLQDEEQRLAMELDSKLAMKKAELETEKRRADELYEREAQLQEQLQEQADAARGLMQHTDDAPPDFATDEEQQMYMYEMLLRKKSELQSQLEAVLSDQAGEGDETMQQYEDDGSEYTDESSGDMTNEELISQGASAIRMAITADTGEDYETAMAYYKQGIDILVFAMQREGNEETRLEIQSKLQDYMTRLMTLREAFEDMAAEEAQQAEEPPAITAISAGEIGEDQLGQEIDFAAAAEYVQELVQTNQLAPQEAMDILNDLMRKAQGQNDSRMEAAVMAHAERLPEPADTDDDDDDDQGYTSTDDDDDDPDALGEDADVAVAMEFMKMLVQEEGLEPEKAQLMAQQFYRERVAATQARAEQRAGAGQGALETTVSGETDMSMEAGGLDMDEAMGVLSDLLKQKESLEQELTQKLAQTQGSASSLGPAGDEEEEEEEEEDLDNMDPGEASELLESLRAKKDMLEEQLKLRQLQEQQLELQQQLAEAEEAELQQQQSQSAGPSMEDMDPVAAAQLLDEIIKRLDQLPPPQQRTAEDNQMEAFLRSKLMELQQLLQSQLQKAQAEEESLEHSIADDVPVRDLIPGRHDRASAMAEDGEVGPAEALAVLDNLLLQKEELQFALRQKLAGVDASSGGKTMEVAQNAAQMLFEQSQADLELEKEITELRTMLTSQAAPVAAVSDMQASAAVMLSEQKQNDLALEAEMEELRERLAEEGDDPSPKLVEALQTLEFLSQQKKMLQAALEQELARGGGGGGGGGAAGPAGNGGDDVEAEALEQSMVQLMAQKDELEAELRSKEQEHLQAEALEDQLKSLLEQKEREQAELSAAVNAEQHGRPSTFGGVDVEALRAEKAYLEQQLQQQSGLAQTMAAYGGEEENAAASEAAEMEAYMQAERDRMFQAMTELQEEKARLQQLMEQEERLQAELSSREAEMSRVQSAMTNEQPGRGNSPRRGNSPGRGNSPVPESAPGSPGSSRHQQEVDDDHVTLEEAARGGEPNLSGEVSRLAFQACLSADADTLQELHDRGYDLNLIKTIPDAKSLAHLAAFRGHIDILRLLGRCNCSLEESTSEGLLPAHYAVFSDNVSVLRYLMVRGCDLMSDDTVDNEGRTPLKLARAIGSEDCHEFLDSLQTALDERGYLSPSLAGPSR